MPEEKYTEVLEEWSLMGDLLQREMADMCRSASLLALSPCLLPLLFRLPPAQPSPPPLLAPKHTEREPVLSHVR
eukprot:2783202-Rhodomonas_salina.1